MALPFRGKESHKTGEVMWQVWFTWTLSTLKMKHQEQHNQSGEQLGTPLPLKRSHRDRNHLPEEMVFTHIPNSAGFPCRSAVCEQGSVSSSWQSKNNARGVGLLFGDLSGVIYLFCCISGSSGWKCAKPGLAEGLWDASAAGKVWEVSSRAGTLRNP